VLSLGAVLISRTVLNSGAVLWWPGIASPGAAGAWAKSGMVLMSWVTRASGWVVPTRVCVTLVCMSAVDRISLAAPADLGERIRASAAGSGVSVSAWLADAAEMKLRNETLGITLAEWFAEVGEPTGEERAAAAAVFAEAGMLPKAVA
jgi:hypothetical protein